MSPSINQRPCQIIGKIFSEGECTHLEKAIAAFGDLEIPPKDLAVIVRFGEEEAAPVKATCIDDGEALDPAR